MDAQVTFPNPKNITLAQSATIGSGSITAFSGIFDGLKIQLIDPENLPDPKDEWVLVFGGASSVGKCAVQTLKAAGYKVVTTCSAKSFDVRCIPLLTELYQHYAASQDPWHGCHG